MDIVFLSISEDYTFTEDGVYALLKRYLVFQKLNRVDGKGKELTVKVFFILLPHFVLLYILYCIHIDNIDCLQADFMSNLNGFA